MSASLFNDKPLLMVNRKLVGTAGFASCDHLTPRGGDDNNTQHFTTMHNKGLEKWRGGMQASEDRIVESYFNRNCNTNQLARPLRSNL